MKKRNYVILNRETKLLDIKKEIKKIDDEWLYIEDIFPDIKLVPGSKCSLPSFKEKVKIKEIMEPRYINPKDIAGSMLSRFGIFEKNLISLIDKVESIGWQPALSGLENDPVEIFELDGKYYVGEGFHRILLAKALGVKNIRVIIKKTELKNM